MATSGDPLFGGPREAGLSSTRVTAPAPTGSGFTGAALPSATADARIRKLRRAAAIDIFDQLDLVVAPGQLWAYIDGAGDPAEGVRHFLFALGVDPELIRAGDLSERSRANEVLELLLEIGGAFDHLTPEVARAVELRLASGDYAQVRHAAHAVQTLARIARLEARWPDQRLAVLTAFLRDVGDSLTDPLTLGPDDLSAAERSADRLTSMAEDVDRAMARFHALASTLRDMWPAGTDGFAAKAADELSFEFESLSAALFDDETLTLVDLDELTTRLHAIVAECEALIASTRSRSRTGSSGSGRSGDHGAGSRARSGPSGALEEARLFFGFEVGNTPDMPLTKKRFHKLALRRSAIIRTSTVTTAP